MQAPQYDAIFDETFDSLIRRCASYRLYKNFYFWIAFPLNNKTASREKCFSATGSCWRCGRPGYVRVQGESGNDHVVVRV